MSAGDDDDLINLLAGSVAGAAVVMVGQPLDTVKTKLQTFRGLYAGPVDCLARTYRATGVRGLYAGVAPALVAGVAENSVLFACYGLCQRTVATVTGTPDVERMDVLSNAVAGCAASFFSSVVLSPTELVKIKLQAGRELAESRGQLFCGSVYQIIKVSSRCVGQCKIIIQTYCTTAHISNISKNPIVCKTSFSIFLHFSR